MRAVRGWVTTIAARGLPAELSSWVSAHISQGCSQEALMATGGAGLFYCFATIKLAIVSESPSWTGDTFFRKPQGRADSRLRCPFVLNHCRPTGSLRSARFFGLDSVSRRLLR